MKWLSYLYMFALVIVASPARADEMSKEEFRQMMGNIAILNYWSKAPSSLMLKCGAQYPDTAQATQTAYLQWKAKDVELDRRVDATLERFVPVVAKMMGKTPDSYQSLATRIVDEEVSGRFAKSFDDVKRHQLCRDFGTLLTFMLSNDLAKPRVNLALENLRPFTKYISK